MSKAEYINDIVLYNDDEDDEIIEVEEMDPEDIKMLSLNTVENVVFQIKSDMEIYCEDNYVNILNKNLSDILDFNNWKKIFN
jgi:hypothetical protein